MLQFLLKRECGFTIAITIPTPHNVYSKAYKTFTTSEYTLVYVFYAWNTIYKELQ